MQCDKLTYVFKSLFPGNVSFHLKCSLCLLLPLKIVPSGTVYSVQHNRMPVIVLYFVYSCVIVNVTATDHSVRCQ